LIYEKRTKCLNMKKQKKKKMDYKSV